MPKLQPYPIIDELAALCTGGRKEELKADLLAYNKGADSPILKHSIEQWFADEPKSPTKGKSRVFLRTFLVTNCDRTKLGTDLVAVYDRLDVELNKSIRAKARDPKEETTRAATILKYGSRLARVLLDATRRSDHSEVNDFFYCSPKGGMDDHSYYLMYRHTATGRVVKAFLVCKRPQPDFPAYSFLTFMRGDRNRFPEQHRESRGAITKWESSYLFLSLAFRMPTDDVDDPDKNVVVRRAAYEEPQFMEMLGFEFDEIGNRHGLFSGVTFTFAVSNQPVVTRVAMLHLGTVKSLGRPIYHQEIELKVLDATDLADDLRETVSRLRDLNCKEFGRRLQADTRSADWPTTRSNVLVEEILSMLDNTPAYEKTLGDASRAPKARGTIGTVHRGAGHLKP